MKLELEQFSGPLDLLLNLLGEQKLSISEISLSQVTEQYLLYLDRLEKNKADELADFLVVGTRLLLLKSRALLPQFATEEEEEEGSLEEQLRLYKQFVDASKKINKTWLNNKKSVFRVEPPRVKEEFEAPSNFSTDILHQSMIQLVSRLKPLKPLPETRIDKAISMKERLDHIRQLLRKKKSVNFHETIASSKNRTDVIVSFLALLELVKQKTVALSQDNNFSDILIKRV